MPTKLKRKPVKYAKGLTKEELKRRKLGVRLCKDVLAQLRVFKIESGFYACGSAGGDVEGMSRKRLVETAIKECRVCAMGVLFLQACKIDGELFPRTPDSLLVRAVDSRKVNGPKGSEIVRSLAPAFSDSQLRLIEWAFEGSLLTSTSLIESRGIRVEMESFKVSEDEYGSRALLRRILKRVVKNGGVFLELGEGRKKTTQKAK